MTAATVLGCLFIAFGAPLAFYTLVVARSSKLVILSIGAGFFWLCGLFVASVFWYPIVPLRDYLGVTVAVSVVTTELFRFLFWMLWTKGQASIAQDAGKIMTSPSAQFTEAVAAGMGQGLTASLVMFAGVLWNGWGPGMLPSKSCPTLSVFFVGALLSLSGTILHVLWTVLAFRGYYNRGIKRVLLVFITHMGCSMLTLLNSSSWSQPGICGASIAPQWAVIVLLGYVLNRDLTPDYHAIVLKR